MLKYGEVNPLAVFGLRRLNHCPPHFTCVEFDSRVNEKELTDWVFVNLTGRFYLGDRYTERDDGSTTMLKCAAFEHPGEASYFALQLDQINSHNLDFV
jgi:hypothetical protein